MAPEEIKYSRIFLSATILLLSYFVAKEEEIINMLTYEQKLFNIPSAVMMVKKHTCKSQDMQVKRY
jgi:hypothetical protein